MCYLQLTARSSNLSKLLIPGGKISRTEFNTLVGIDPNYRDLAITNPELFDFTDDGIQENNSIPTITTQEEYDNLPQGAEYIANGIQYIKGE